MTLNYIWDIVRNFDLFGFLPTQIDFFHLNQTLHKQHLNNNKQKPMTVYHTITITQKY